MTATAHRIRRQQWRVRAPAAECAFAARMQLRAEMDSLLGVFEEAFDAVAANDEIVRIPMLALEVKLPPEASIAEAFPPLLLEELGKVLRRWSASVPPACGARRMPRSASRREMLLHYLEHGGVRWHESSGTPQAIASDLRAEARTLASDIASFTSMLEGSMARRTAMCFRWLELLDADERSRAIAAALEPRRPGDDASLLALRDMAGRRELSEYEALRTRSLVLAFASLDASEHDASTRPMLREALEPIRQSAVREASAERDAAPRGSFTEPVDAAVHRVGPARAALAEAAAAEPVAEGLAACDAGLVLLHPYLPRLFEAAGIVAGGVREIAELSLPRAAALLHYLLRDDEEIHEFELVLIKVLLGISPDRMVLVGSGLSTAQDREEADALLAAVLTHWPGLGSTSATGLRRTFLQRRGTLRDLGAAWSLQVEPGAFDVLLARLPWTIGTVRLPWMTRPIFIDWPTR